MSSRRTRLLLPVWPVSCLPIFDFLFSIIFLALFCARTALALDPALDISQYAHTAWKVRDGFTKGGIISIAQTQDGYLWLGTDFGLYRFDGVHAIPWQPPNGEQLSYVWSLLTSRDGTLWIGTRKGLFSWKDAKLSKYPELAGRTIVSLLEDHEGTIWAGEFESRPDGRLCAIRHGAAECTGGLGRGVLSLYEDGNGNVWVGSEGGFWHWKPGPRKFYPFGTRKNPVQSFAEDGDGRLLIAVPNMGVYRLLGGTQEPQYALPKSGERGVFYRMLRDRDGALWIDVYDRGLLHVSEDRIDSFTVRDGLSGDAINALFQDREGNIWVATANGLDRFRNFAIPTWSEQQGLPFAPGSAALAASDGSIWTGSSKGLGRLSRGQITIYRRQRSAPVSSRDVREIFRPELPESSMAFLQDHLGRIWVSSLHGRVGYVEDQQYHPIGPIGTNTLVSLAEDSHGDLWIHGREEGLFRLHDGEIAERVSWADLGRKAGEICDRLAVDPSRAGLWIACRSGGITYFKDGQVRASYSASDGLGGGVVNDLRFDSSGSMWAATESGLSRIKDGRVMTLTSKNGLPCDTVHWTIEDDDHLVWLYMACGLVRIARSELDAWASDANKKVWPTIFDASDGARVEALPTGASPQVSKAPDGKIWFASVDGISVIDPRHLQYNKMPPPVHIEQIMADGKEYDTSSMGNGRQRLPPLVRDLTIDYTALSLVVPEKVRFRVKLEGQDKDWRELTDRRVHYTNLAPKHYRFLVKACNNSGVWNEEGAALDFVIPPAYYQTNWFRTLCVVAFLGLLWILHHVRVRVLEQRQELLEQNQTLIQRHATEITALNDRLMKAQEEERTRIAGELHDGVLQQISSITLLLGAVKYKVPANSEATEKIGGLQQRLIAVGTEIRELSHELHPAVLKEGGLPEALSEYCEEFSMTRGIPVTCETDATAKELSRGAALVLYRIAQEALGNVAKHSQAKRVQVRLARINGRVRLTVTDDGVGCSPDRAREAGGLGLVNMRERTRQLKGTFEFQSEPGRGSTVTAEVPFRPAS